MSDPKRWIPVLCACLLLAATSRARADGSAAGWEEHFNRPSLDWIDPFDHGAAQLRRVYSVGAEGPQYFLHARHDATTSSRPPALDYGRAFVHDARPLSRVIALRWKWRVLRHPAVTDDPWLDCAASLYVVIRTPSVFKGGRGFKFAWLAKPGPTGTHQHGLLQVPMRSEPATTEWRSESVDLCALYRKEYGATCDGENVLYVGVVTDADGTRSIAEADYADFGLVMRP